MLTFKNMIELWPSTAAMARDVGISQVRARAWKNRNSIPAERWLEFLRCAEARGFTQVTLEALAQAASAGDVKEPKLRSHKNPASNHKCEAA